MPIYGGDTGSVITQMVTVPSDHLLAAWAFDPANLQGGLLALGGGTLQVTRVKVVNTNLLVNPGQITNIIFDLTAGGLTLTSGRNFAALYSDAGQLLGQTADQSTAWLTSGVKTMPLASPVSVSPWTWLKIAWFNNGITAPSLARGMNVDATVLNAGLSGSTLRWSTADTGLTTTLPSSIGTQTASGNAWWAALN